MVCGRQPDRGRQVERDAKAAGHDLTFVRADVTEDPHRRRLVDELPWQFRRLDILVNNAGGCRPRMEDESIADYWRY